MWFVTTACHVVAFVERFTGSIPKLWTVHPQQAVANSFCTHQQWVWSLWQPWYDWNGGDRCQWQSSCRNLYEWSDLQNCRASIYNDIHQRFFYVSYGFSTQCFSLEAGIRKKSRKELRLPWERPHEKSYKTSSHDTIAGPYPRDPYGRSLGSLGIGPIGSEEYGPTISCWGSKYGRFCGSLISLLPFFSTS